MLNPALSLCCTTEPMLYKRDEDKLERVQQGKSHQGGQGAGADNIQKRG